MSLTSELSSSGSPVRAYLEFVATLVCDTKRGSLLEEPAKKLLGFDTIPKTPPVAPLAGANPGTLGTAFDYRLRYDLNLSPCTIPSPPTASCWLVGQAEAALAQAIPAFLANTDRLAADLAADRCRLSDSDNRELIRRYVVLALLESVFRSGMYTHLLPIPERLINLVSDVVVADVEALYRSALTVFEPLAGPCSNRAGDLSGHPDVRRQFGSWWRGRRHGGRRRARPVEDDQDTGGRRTALGAVAAGRLLPARLRRHLWCPPGRRVLRPPVGKPALLAMASISGSVTPTVRGSEARSRTSTVSGAGGSLGGWTSARSPTQTSSMSPRSSTASVAGVSTTRAPLPCTLLLPCSDR